MSAIFKQKGDSIDYTPGADVASGDVVVQGELAGVAKLDIKAGNLGALAVTGVFDFPKATGAGSAMAAGVKAYWDEAPKVATEDAAGGVNKYLGKTVAETGDEAATVRVRMSQ
jgi:predicted RecA/RadA family phage recombinase